MANAKQIRDVLVRCVESAIAAEPNDIPRRTEIFAIAFSGAMMAYGEEKMEAALDKLTGIGQARTSKS
jgi:hypothetical protein